MNENVLKHGPFTGGVRYDLPADEIAFNQLFSAANIRIGRAGDCFQRDGVTPWTDTDLRRDAPFQFLGKHTFQNPYSEEVFCINDKLFYYKDSEGAWANKPLTGLANGATTDRWDFCNAGGTLIGTTKRAGVPIISWPTESGNLAAFSTSNTIANASTCEWFDGRLWFGDTSRFDDEVIYSGQIDFTVWENLFFRLGRPITAIKNWANRALAVHSKDGITLISPTHNPTVPYRVQGVSGKGTVAKDTLVDVTSPDGISAHIFVADDGIYQFSGGEAQKISWALDGERYWNDVNQSLLEQAFALHNPRRSEVWFFLPHSNIADGLNHVIVYDYLRKIWYGPHTFQDPLTWWECGETIDNMPIACSASEIGTKHAPFLMDFTEKVSDEVFPKDNQQRFARVAIAAHMETSGKSPFDSAAHMCRWIYVRMSANLLTDNNANISWIGPVTQGNGIVRHVAPIDKIGISFTIGVSAIAGNRIASLSDTPLTGISPNIQFRISNAVRDEAFAVAELSTVYRPLRTSPSPRLFTGVGRS